MKCPFDRGIDQAVWTPSGSVWCVWGALSLSLDRLQRRHPRLHRESSFRSATTTSQSSEVREQQKKWEELREQQSAAQENSRTAQTRRFSLELFDLFDLDFLLVVPSLLETPTVLEL